MQQDIILDEKGNSTSALLQYGETNQILGFFWKLYTNITINMKNLDSVLEEIKQLILGNDATIITIRSEIACEADNLEEIGRDSMLGYTVERFIYDPINREFKNNAI